MTLPSLLDIGLDVEIGKEEEKHCTMEQNNIAENFWEITLNKKRQAGMDEKCDKLSQLQGS